MTYLLTLFILLDTAHVLSPIALSWCRSGFRRLMLQSPCRYIVTPMVIFIAGAAVAVISAALGRGMCWVTMLKLYIFWNFFHFSMQNYGVLRLCGLRNKPVGMALAFSGTALGIMFIPVAVSVHHWITDLGLSARAMGRRGWLFIVALLFLAPVAFLWDRAPWLWPQLDAVAYQPMTPLIILWVGLRYATGMAHFKVSAMVWRFRDPRIRAAIGNDLIGPAWRSA